MCTELYGQMRSLVLPCRPKSHSLCSLFKHHSKQGCWVGCTASSLLWLAFWLGKLNAVYSNGSDPTEPGTLLADISEGRLRVTQEPAIASFISQSLRACLWEGLLCTSFCCISFNPTATCLFGKLWQHPGPVYPSEGIMEDKSPLFEAISLAL